MSFQLHLLSLHPTFFKWLAGMLVVWCFLASGPAGATDAATAEHAGHGAHSAMVRMHGNPEMSGQHSEHETTASSKPCHNPDCLGADCETSCSMDGGCYTSVVVIPSVSPLLIDQSATCPSAYGPSVEYVSKFQDSSLRPPIV